jgi:hypothetical protein
MSSTSCLRGGKGGVGGGRFSKSSYMRSQILLITYATFATFATLLSLVQNLFPLPQWDSRDRGDSISKKMAPPLNPV